jgi:hypothetical protein
LIIQKICRINDNEQIRAYAFYGSDNNHPFVILCQKARENNGQCPEGRRYICEFGSFVDEKLEVIKKIADGDSK